MFNHEPKEYDCPFCTFANGGETDFNKKGDIVFEDDEVLAYISPKWWPNNPGNVMIIPKQHVEHVYDISDQLLDKIYALGKKVAIGMKKEYGCDGTSFRQHNEPAGDQEVWHFHLHVLPRWENDDLYINYENAKTVTEEERAPYVKKLSNFFRN